ncbi:MAG: alpha-N-acetylglucosaminidase [Muribaculaceae bacterium]
MKRYLLLMATALTVAVVAGASGSKAAQDLCRRIVGAEHAKMFSFVQYADSLNVDRYCVEASKGKIVIKGNNANSMAVGLNQYLVNVCHTSVTWWANDKVQLPNELPLPKQPICGKAACPNRFFLNYCTFGYTMPYWKWDNWERLIDWMALNGINMPLAITGQESIWLKVWKKLGLKEDDIKSYFTGPAHLAWHRMSNIDAFQGPLPDSWLRDQELLQKKIVARERELSMTPILPGFAGHVPGKLREIYPDAKITMLSNWCGFENRCRSFFLDPEEPLYAQIQKLFITEQTKAYGTNHIYGVDPFNELDSPDWSEAYLAKVSRMIYQSLLQADDQAQWLQMTWTFYNDGRWTKPRVKAFLDAVPKDKLINLDYYCDYKELWPDLDRYFGGRYIWCYLGNFGGNTMTEGDIAGVEKKLNRVMAEGGSNFDGVGATLEGFDTNEQMYEYVFQKVWNQQLTGAQWFELWARMHGGDADEHIINAWRILGEKVYVRAAGCGKCTLISARPALVGVGGNYTSSQIHYPEIEIWNVWNELLQAKDVDNDGYRYDVVNIGRQALGNLFSHFRRQFTISYTIGDKAQAQVWAQRMDELIADYNRLISCEKHLSMGAWIEEARSLGYTEAEKDYYELNARTLLTTWGHKGGVLVDYASRGWSGLTDTYCRVRWQRFTQAVIDAMDKGVKFSQEEFCKEIEEFEYQWTFGKEKYPIVSGENAVDVARELAQKYASYSCMCTL